MTVHLKRMKLVTLRTAAILLALLLLYAMVQIPPKNEKNENGPIVVLSWHAKFGYQWLTNDETEHNWTKLGPGCFLTNDRQRYFEADVVIFSWLYADFDDLPNFASRPKGQLWVLYSGESPAYTQITVLETLKDFINFTSSYRLDDDFAAPFGSFRKLRQPKLRTTTNYSRQHKLPTTTNYSRQHKLPTTTNYPTQTTNYDKLPNPTQTTNYEKLPNPTQTTNYDQLLIPTQTTNYDQLLNPTQTTNYDQLLNPTQTTNYDQLLNPTQTTNTVKNGRIAWLVSHCQTDSKRERYIAKLNESITVDEYGQCSKKWPTNCGEPYNDVLGCYAALANYTFYLAFENSICRDYATEKVFFAYHVGIIPVVFGGYDYATYLPPNSYVNAMDYPNPADLAMYLKRLLKSDSELNAFYDWKFTHELSVSLNPGMDAVRKIVDYLKRNKGLKTCKNRNRNRIWWWYFENQCKKWYNKTQTYETSVVGKYERSTLDDVAGFMPGGLLERLEEL